VVLDHGLVTSRKPDDLLTPSARRCWRSSARRGGAPLERNRRCAVPQETNLMASSRQKSKVHKVMSEHKQGTLESGSGKKVKSREQAVAIAMSESGRSKKRKKAS
jgi:hypothetical protein